MAPSSKADYADVDHINVEQPLGRFDTNASITIPKDVFEKLYLTPKLPVKGELRSTLGNPTPL